MCGPKAAVTNFAVFCIFREWSIKPDWISALSTSLGGNATGRDYGIHVCVCVCVFVDEP